MFSFPALHNEVFEDEALYDSLRLSTCLTECAKYAYPLPWVGLHHIYFFQFALNHVQHGMDFLAKVLVIECEDVEDLVEIADEGLKANFSRLRVHLDQRQQDIVVDETRNFLVVE